jgi:hypothetical protein
MGCSCSTPQLLCLRSPLKKNPIGGERKAGASARGRERSCFIEPDSLAKNRGASLKEGSQAVAGAGPAHLREVGQGRASSNQTRLPSKRFSPGIQGTQARHCSGFTRLVSTAPPGTKTAQPRIRMQIQGSAFPLRLPLARPGIRASLARARQQPANPSIERTRPGKPGRASHVKR